MAFHKVGETVKFPRDEYVDIHVRNVTLNADAPASEQFRAVEIREFLREGEVYGHGLVLPLNAVRDLKVALERLTHEPEAL